jgi:hypothetical protein
MDARTKPTKTARKRMQRRALKRVEVTVGADDVALVRKLAANLRRDDANAERLRAALRSVLRDRRGVTLAQSLYDPVVAGPEFDKTFEEIERFRHDPTMAKTRNTDL